MQEQNKEEINKKKQILCKAIGKVVQKFRTEQKKGINLFSYENDLPNVSLDKVEKGLRDVQITTLWRMANAFGLNFGEFIALVEAELPKGFSFTED
jgi:transcriptional regulator with XRE-family HTH domain